MWNIFETLSCITALIRSVYVNPFEPPKPKLGGSGAMITGGSPCSRRMRYAATAARRNNLSSDTDEAWADALDREEEEDRAYRQLQQETTGGEDPAAAAAVDWKPKVSSAGTLA